MAMRCTISIIAATLVILIAADLSVGAVEIRGQVATGDFEWNAQNFAGFYYDINKDIGTENLTFRLTGIDPAQRTLSKMEDSDGNRGVVYISKAQPVNFKYKPWGQYYAISFLGNKYFAAYSDAKTESMNADGLTEPYLYNKSANRNLMINGEIGKVLIDDDKEQMITSTNPLKLAEGYQLDIKQTGPVQLSRLKAASNNFQLTLRKNDVIVDSRIVSPSIEKLKKMKDYTYYYKTKIGKTADIVQIAVHFNSSLLGANASNITIDGVFQISDAVTSLEVDQQYGKMSLRDVDPDAMVIKMDNKDNQINLGRDKDVWLMNDIYIKTADQDNIDAFNPLRFYVYRKLKPGESYEIRGAVHNFGEAEAIWDNSSFAGFYYDLDENIGKEILIFRPTGKDPSQKTLSDREDANGDRGVVYISTAQLAKIKFEPWGQYYAISFLGDNYFAAYSDAPTATMLAQNLTNPYLYNNSVNRNLMLNGQIDEVLINDDEERTITSGEPLMLEEGYELAIKSIDIDGNKVYLDLSKDGAVVDSKVISPSKDEATMADKIYYYRKDIGGTKDIIIIAVHFKNAFRGADQNLATVDGVFQISDTTTTLQSEMQYDKMSIRKVDPIAISITMDNKNNPIALGKNEDIILMQNVRIKTADQDVINDAQPLRFYIYKVETEQMIRAETMVVGEASGEWRPMPPMYQAGKGLMAFEEELTPPPMEDMKEPIPPTGGEIPLIKFGNGEPILPPANST